MKKAFLLFCTVVLFAITGKAQNSDNLFFNSTLSGYDYRAASFVIDTALPAYPFKRAMLLWAANTAPATANRYVSLDETNANGVPQTEHINVQVNGDLRSLQPKRIIRSRFSKSYYLLGYVINSTNLINGFTVNSSAYVLKLDDNLNLLWSSKIHFNTVTAANAGALIEYNDIIETNDRNIVLVGRYARTTSDRQALQLAKLDQATGLNIWWYWYYLWSCHANGLSVAEASNGELAVTGYAEQCTLPSFNGNRQLLYARVRSDGSPLQFRKFLFSRPFSGDKITRFINTAGANRFFITGYIDIPTTTGAAVNRQNLVVDISQNGNINRATHFGDAGSEEINDHLFSRLPIANQFNLSITGYTTSYIGNNIAEGYFSILRYNATTLTFTLLRYDVLRNVYPGTSYNSRRGIELKVAGSNRFAILLNSSLTITTPAPAYTHSYTNVYVRDLAVSPADTLCHRPKTPPLTNINWIPNDTVAVWLGPNYKIYPENWTTAPKIQNKVLCGSIWQIFPNQAVLALIMPPDEYTGPGDVVPLPTTATRLQAPVAGDILYPNPAGNQVNLVLDKVFSKIASPLRISLYTPAMQLISSQQVTAQPVQRISLAGLLPGMYLVQVQQGSTMRLYRFVKQ